MNAAERPLPERLAAGDPHAFAELYDAYVPAIHGWLWARSGRKDLAEDVVQAVMLRCVRHREGLARVRDLRAWLFAVARNEWGRAGGRERRATALDGPAADALPARADEPPGGEEMRGLVARLRPERREVVVLHAWHGLTFDEIGSLLDTSPNTVASRWRLALEELGHAWKAGGHGRD